LSPKLVKSMKNSGLMFLDHCFAEPDSDSPVPPAADVLKAQPPDLGASLLGACWRVPPTILIPSTTVATKIYSAPVLSSFPGCPSGRQRGRKLRRPIAAPPPKVTGVLSKLGLIPEDTPEIVADVPKPPPKEKKPSGRPSQISPSPEDLGDASEDTKEAAQDTVTDALAPRAACSKGFSSKGFSSKGFSSKGFNSKGFSSKGFSNKGRSSSVVTIQDMDMDAANMSGAFAPPIARGKTPTSAPRVEDAELAGDIGFSLDADDLCEQVFRRTAGAHSNPAHSGSSWSEYTMRDYLSNTMADAVDWVGNSVLNKVFQPVYEREDRSLAGKTAARALDEAMCWLAEEKTWSVSDGGAPLDLDTVSSWW